MNFVSRLFSRANVAPRGAPEPARPRIFISYAHQPRDQAALVREIGKALSADGFDIWFDENDIAAGDVWRNAIVNGLLTTDRTLAFLSAHALRPDSVCLQELALSLHHRPGNLVTVLLEPEKQVAVPVPLGEVQWLDMSTWRHRQKARRRDWHTWRDAQITRIAELLRDKVNRSFEGEIKELARRLNPLFQATDTARLIDGFIGREWLATLVNDWRRHETEQRMMLLTGPAGIGKSAFAAWLTHFARANVIGLTLSQQRVAASRSPANVVRTLAFQIASRLPEYRSLLLERLQNEDPQGERIATMEPGPLFSFLLAELLKLVPDGGRTFDRFLLVIDGLDETLEGNRCPLAELFEWHTDTLPAWLCVLLTSRRHHVVERALSRARVVRIEERPENNAADIRDYVERWLADLDPPLPDRAASVQRAIEAAYGNFQYLALLRDEVKNDPSLLAAPARLPRGLIALYSQWMERQFRNVEYDAWRTMLAVLAVAHNPVPEALLAEMLDLAALEKVGMLERLEGLFERRDGTVAPAHDSLREWLISERAAGRRFMVLANTGRTLLANELWRRFVTWMDQPEAALDWFLVAELPAQLREDDEATLRRRLGDAGLWSRLAELLGGLLEALRAALAWRLLLDWLMLIERMCNIIGDEAVTLLVSGLNARGDTLGLLGDSRGALEAYQSALDIEQSRVSNAPAEVGLQRNLSAIHDRIGDVLVTHGDLPGALAAHRESLTIAETLAAGDPTDNRLQGDLSVSYDKVGDVLVAQGDPAGALAFYRKGLAIRGTLAARDSQWEYNLSASHDKIGDVLVAQGDLSGALASYRKSLAIREMLAARNASNAQMQSDLSASHDKIGDVLVKQGDPASALASYRKGLPIRETLSARDSGNAHWQRDLSLSSTRIGDVLMAQGGLPDALTSFRKSLAIAETLAARDASNSRWHHDLAINHVKIGDVLLEQGDLPGALASYRNDLAIMERLAARDPSNTAWQRDLSISHQRIGRMRRNEGDLPGALAAFRAALAICHHLAEQDTSVADWQFGVANNLDFVAGVMERQRDPAGALSLYQQALAIRERLAALAPASVTYARMPSLAHRNIGVVLLRLGQPERAREAAQTAVKLAGDALSRFPDDKVTAQTLRAAEMLLDATSEQNPLAHLGPNLAEPPPSPPSPPPRDLRLEARAALTANQPAEALDLLREAPDDGRTANLRAVCLLRLGRPQEARATLDAILSPDPPEGTADTWVVTYATAQFLAGDARAAGRSLDDWVRNRSHRGAVRLREAIATWDRKRPPSLPYPPGEW